jgi:uncharacterized membrane protein YbhN (UPF0104 family)
LRWLLLASGATLLGWLVRRNDPMAVLGAVSGLSWRLLIVLVFPFTVVVVLDTLGWRYAFPDSHVPFRTLLWTRIVGEAVNVTTPTASVGGEAVKAWLLRPHVALTDALSSVIVAKTTITIAQGLMLAFGIVCAWAVLPADSGLLRPMEWLLLVEVVAVGGFVAVQLGGVVGAGGRLLARFGMPRAAAGGAALHDSLGGFYRRSPSRLALSIGFHFLGWVVSALETYLIIMLLGLEVSLLTTMVIEAASTAVRFATFMVPGSLGVLEGGHVAVFVALGLTGAAALSFSLVRRIREAAWAGVGFIVLAALSRSAAPAPAD